MRRELLRLDRVTVMREGVPLLDSLSMHLFAGEIVGLIPLNAQGLEELLELIGRNVPLHYGYVWFDERPVNDYRREHAGVNQVAVLEKRSRLIGAMNAPENIFVVRGGMRKYLIDDRTLADQLSRLCAELGIEIPAETPVEKLPLFIRWTVELLRAVVAGAKLVIVRDIGGIAGPVDLSRIHRLIRHYAARGLTFLNVCTHHEEVFSLCDRALLMKDGRIVRTLTRDRMTDEVMRHFTRSFVRFEPDAPGAKEHRPPETGARTVLRVERVRERSVRNLSFGLREGECAVLLDQDDSLLGPFAGLFRDGRPPETGRITIDGVPVRAADRRYAFIDEKPVRSTLFPDLSYLDNLCFLADRRLRWFWTRRRFRQSVRREYYPLVGPVIDAPSLSGLTLHDLYELVYHRVLLQKPRLAVCLQPFAGIDMYQRFRLVELIETLRRRRIAVLILSVNLSDSLQVADRLLVARNGAIERELAREEFAELDSLPISKI